MKRVIDLRSDTVTVPSPGMREAMANAEVGDDMFGDDSTVKRLEARVAEMAGKEAALFVPSGTMGNQISLRCHAKPGDEVICDGNSHIVHYEGGAAAAVSGLCLLGLPGARGIFNAEMVRAAIRPDNIHHPISRLVVVENTHNRGGGSVWPLQQISEVARVAREHGLSMHLDGARIFNAVAATGITLKEWCTEFDTVSICFSKGLGAPVGSAIVGSSAFIKRALRVRKIMGGAMRQVGILAAACEYALDHNIARMKEDHENARLLISKLSEVERFDVEPGLETNMVFWNIRGTYEEAVSLADRCNSRGVRFFCIGGTRFRAVTHLNLNNDDILYAASVIAEEVEKLKSAG